ncbi:MAG TPA: DUF4178 domain-containing protein [Thermomicrobiales bacterium]|nr:DUF4178 domain-containing protein [Thermomicrobiales bacterium]
MSSWAKRDLNAAGQHRSSWLDKIPGYAGYRNKESRRDDDKRLRESLAAEYNQLAGRLTAVQGDLARGGKLSEIGTIEQLERALRLFVDRLRTASYGYAGLFSDHPVEERALDQLQAFDRALGDGVDQVRAGVEALESAARGGDLAGPEGQLRDAIDDLNRRFDLRGQVLESGQPQQAASLDSVFGSAQAHVAGDLHFGDAVAIAGANYASSGLMEFHDGDDAWRQYLLRGDQGEKWLHVPPTTAQPMALLDRAAETPGEGPQVTVGGTAYAQTAAGTALADVAGESGRQTGRTVHYRRFASGAPASPRLRLEQASRVLGGGAQGMLLFAYDWGAERQTLVGRTLDPLEVKVFPRAGGGPANVGS